MLSDPNLTHVEEALRALDFLVVQDIFLTETAQLAHVVLPAAASPEKDGTYHQHRAPRAAAARPWCAAPGEARPDWQIVAGGDWRAQLDAKLRPARARPTVRWELPLDSRRRWTSSRSVTPSYGGMRHDRLRRRRAVLALPDARPPGHADPAPRQVHPRARASSTPSTSQPAGRGARRRVPADPDAPGACSTTTTPAR